MTKIKLKDERGHVLETLKIKHAPTRFILIRGRLFEWDQTNPKSYEYIQRAYLEIS